MTPTQTNRIAARIAARKVREAARDAKLSAHAAEHAEGRALYKTIAAEGVEFIFALDARECRILADAANREMVRTCMGADDGCPSDLQRYDAAIRFLGSVACRLRQLELKL